MPGMSIAVIIVSIIYIISCVALVVIILSQKKRTAGLGSGMSGMGDSGETYWDRNKGRSIEGTLEKYSKLLGAAFFILSLALCVIH